MSRVKKDVRRIIGQSPIAIVGDGQLELEYFTQFRTAERALALTIEPQLPNKGGKGGTHMKVLNKAKALWDSGDFSRVYCLIDFDTIVSEQKEAVYEEQKQKLVQSSNGKLVFIENHPCFEVWFLLHYQTLTKSYSRCDDVVRDLKLHLTDYKKTGRYYSAKQIYTFLKPAMCRYAMANARQTDTPHAKLTLQGRSALYKFFEDLDICP
jgi:hypothetical protein